MQCLEIEFSDGRRERHPLGAQTTIGSAASAQIRVPELADEHVLLAPQGESVWVSGAEGAAPVCVDGRSVGASYVPWDTELVVAGLRILLRRDGTDHSAEEVGNSKPREADNESKAGRFALLATVGLVLAGAIIMKLEFTSSQRAPSLDRGAQTLFEAVPPCDADNPLHSAQSDAQAALAKSERYVFDPQDGVRAVTLLERAARCFRRAGEEALHDRLRKEAQRLRATVESDVQLHRLRLERALAAGRTKSASQHIQFLQSAYGHRGQSSFYRGLRQLQTRLSAAKKEQP